MSVAGIDFGNDQSVVAIARRRGIDVCANEVSKRETASLVSFTQKLRVLGESAASQQASNLKNTCGNFKRLIGRSFNDPEVQAEIKHNNVETVATRDGGVGYKVWYGGEQRVFSATQVTSMYLFCLREIAEKEAGARVVDVVVSAPVWYSDQQRRALVDAAQIAGFNVLALLNESTATAVAWGMPKTDLPETTPINVVFVDLGQTTTTCTAVSFTSKKMTVLGTKFDRHLGGRDFDQVLVDHFVAFAKTKGLNVTSNPRAMFRLGAACNKMKMVLSANSEAITTVECLMDDRDLQLRISRDEYTALCAPLLARLNAPCAALLAETGLNPADLFAVEVVGGTCRIPSVKDALRAVFGRDLSFTLNTSESVGRGCALMGAVLSPLFSTKEFEINDLSLYPVTLTWRVPTAAPAPGFVRVEPGNSDCVDQLFIANNPVPSVKQMTFAPSQHLELGAFYSEGAQLPGGVDRFIGRFVISDAPKPTAGRFAKIKAKARLNWHGVLSVSDAQLVEELEAPAEAAAPASPATPATPADAEAEKKKEKVKVSRTNLTLAAYTTGMSKTDLQEAMEAERAMELRDKDIRETAEAKNSFEGYIYDTRSKIAGKMGPFVSDADKATLKGLFERNERWLEDASDDTPKNVYLEKLKEMQALGEPAARRQSDASERERYAEQLRQSVATNKALAINTDWKYEHIDADERSKVQAEVAQAEQWLNDTMASIASQPLHVNPPAWNADFAARKTALDAACSKIMSRPKPAPPAPAPAPAPAADQAPAAEGEKMQS